jgi:hypothetical protein
MGAISQSGTAKMECTVSAQKLVLLSIYIFFQPASLGIQIFPSGGTSGNAVLIWIEQFRSFHLLNVSFSLCDSVLLRYFELLLHPQPTILSISTIVRPIGVNVLILSVSTQSKALRRFRLFEYLFDLEIGLLEHWLFGRWTKDPSEKKCFSGITTTWQCLRHLFLALASVNLKTYTVLYTLVLCHNWLNNHSRLCP